MSTVHPYDKRCSFKSTSNKPKTFNFGTKKCDAMTVSQDLQTFMQFFSMSLKGMYFRISTSNSRGRLAIVVDIGNDIFTHLFTFLTTFGLFCRFHHRILSWANKQPMRFEYIVLKTKTKSKHKPKPNQASRRFQVRKKGKKRWATCADESCKDDRILKELLRWRGVYETSWPRDDV